MTVRMFLKQKSGAIIAIVFILLSIRLLGFACKVQPDYIVAVTVLILVCTAAVFIPEFYKKHKFYKELKKILDGLDQKYLITEMMLEPGFEEGDLWMDVLYEIGKSMKDKLNEMEDSVLDFKEYLELWIHEIKIPMAALQLMNFNGNPDTKKQKQQLDRLDAYVEQILFYARADTPEKDYLLTACQLDSVINQVLQQQKDLLIGHRIRIEKVHTDVEVVTDSKWLVFIIGQIVNNSIKYIDREKNPMIRFSIEDTDEAVRLSIWDNGIGICKKDVERVFDKTFTGENGRKGKASTGMGLYICKQLCRKLGHSITITSQMGIYTEVTLTFGKENFYTT